LANADESAGAAGWKLTRIPIGRPPEILKETFAPMTPVPNLKPGQVMGSRILITLAADVSSSDQFFLFDSCFLL
jgi:hypothetical protein